MCLVFWIERACRGVSGEGGGHRRVRRRPRGDGEGGLDQARGCGDRRRDKLVRRSDDEEGVRELTQRWPFSLPVVCSTSLVANDIQQSLPVEPGVITSPLA